MFINTKVKAITTCKKFYILMYCAQKEATVNINLTYI
jgi:hypothetical protein